MNRTTKQLIDAYGRRIDYLRISLTDKCNLRCRYCMPKEGIMPLRHEEVLTLEEIRRVAEVLTELGIRRIRVTGGEPWRRPGFGRSISVWIPCGGRPTGS